MSLLTLIKNEYGTRVSQSVVSTISSQLWTNLQDQFLSNTSYEPLYNNTDPNVKILLKMELTRLRNVVVYSTVDAYTPYTYDTSVIPNVYQATVDNFNTQLDWIIGAALDNWHGDQVEEINGIINTFLNSFEEWIASLPALNIQTKNQLAIKIYYPETDLMEILIGIQNKPSATVITAMQHQIQHTGTVIGEYLTLLRPVIINGNPKYKPIDF
jgi:hypothetical protein